MTVRRIMYRLKKETARVYFAYRRKKKVLPQESKYLHGNFN